MNKADFKKHGMEFISQGFNIIPLYSYKDESIPQDQRGKRPKVPWVKYQNEKATEKDINEWAELGEDLNIGIVCGVTSNITVVDADSDEAVSLLENELKVPATLKVKTRKGFHYYFKYCPNPAVNNAIGAIPKIDIRTQGAQVVAPYSTHYTGHVYEWYNQGTPIVDFPQNLEEIYTKMYKEKNSRESGKDYDITKELVSGKRNKTLASMGGILHHAGVPQHLVEMFLLELNKCSPDPDEDDVVASVAKSVCRYQNSPPSEKWTDYGLGTAFLNEHGDKLLYSEEAFKWYFYNGAHWKGCYTQKGSYLNAEIMDMLVGFLTSYACTIPDDDDNKEKFLKYLKDYEGVGKMTNFLKGVAARVATPEGKFDPNPYLFNCKNAVLNLKTGEAIPHNKDFMLSKLSGVVYDPDAKCPVWEAFLDRIFEGNAELIKYIQTALGYTMIGKIREKAVFLLVGEGDNGKSKFLDAIGNIFDVDNDQYGTYTNFSTFTTSRDGEIRCDLASLRGARYVYASEGKADAMLDDTVIKSITGDDRIRARLLYQNEIIFRPEFKIWLATNKTPYIKSTELAMRVRIKLINFNVVIPKEEQDQFLGDKLKSEASGILNWILIGLMRYNKEGLIDCADVVKDTKEYMDSMDLYKQFFDENFEYAEGASFEARPLFSMYDTWVRRKEQTPVSETRFGREFAKHMRQTHGVNIIKIPSRKEGGGNCVKYMNIRQVGAEY